MITRPSRALPLLLLGLALAATACRRQGVEPAVAVEPSQDDLDAARRDSLERARRLAEQNERPPLPETNAADRERRLAEMQSALMAPVYFEFNQAELPPDARMTLDAKVPVLQANPAIRIRIAGHTDSRGSDEYNLALGQRRAAAVREYLMANGIDGSRLEIVSFGEELPAVEGNDEGAWAQNRRAEFEITAGELTNVGDN